MDRSAIPTFETARLMLRAPTMDDVPAYEKYFIDYDVVKYLNALIPWPYPQGGIADFLQTQIFPNQGNERWMWGLFRKENPGELIGAIELWKNRAMDNRGFWLGKPFWGHGYMTEAAARTNDYAFDELGFEKLIYSNATENARSRRIKEKTGARFLFAEPFKFVDPNINEREVWELTKDDWRNFARKSNAPSPEKVPGTL